MMKWTFIIQQKFKAILLLTVLILSIALTSFLEQRNMEQMDESFTSIYYDRLIPATEIFHLTEDLFNKRIILQPFVNSSRPLPKNEAASLLSYHHEITDGIERFEKTLLVSNESNALALFKKLVGESKEVEDEIIRLLDQGDSEKAQTLYRQKFQPLFADILRNLDELSTIQTAVGMDMLKESKTTISNSDLVLTLQIITAIVIGLIVHALIFASRSANLQEKNFRLN